MRRLTALLALLLVPALAGAQVGATPVAAERSFVERMATTFEQQDNAPEAPKDPAPSPAPAAKKPSETDPEPDAPEPETGPPLSTPKEPDADDPDDDQGDEPPESDDADGASEDERAEEALDEEFVAAAKRSKVALTVDDLPDEAKPLVKKRIRELEAGFTNAMKEAREYRKDEAKLKAEERYRSENTAEYVADMLLKDPTLGEAVNALLDGITTETARTAHDIVVTDRRAKALKATEDAIAAKASRDQRGLALDSYARTQALKHGVPFEFVGEAIVADMGSFDFTAHDYTEREIDAIVLRKKKEYENHTRAIRREASKKYVADKVEARKTGGLKVKPGSGNAPAPASKPRARSDAEFIEGFVGRM